MDLIKQVVNIDTTCYMVDLRNNSAKIKIGNECIVVYRDMGAIEDWLYKMYHNRYMYK